MTNQKTTKINDSWKPTSRPCRTLAGCEGCGECAQQTPALKNLTPHIVNIFDEEGELIVSVQPEIVSARVKTSRESLGKNGNIPIFKNNYSDVEGLPEPLEDTIFVVSAKVAERAKRDDVMYPGELIRDASGQPVGCIGLTAHV
jgi:hypothetical protein